MRGKVHRRKKRNKRINRIAEASRALGCFCFDPIEPFDYRFHSSRTDRPNRPLKCFHFRLLGRVRASARERARATHSDLFL